MFKTISLKLNLDPAQAESLRLVQSAYADACNALVPIVVNNRCWNRFSLHNLSYNQLRPQSPLGSQMVCNAIFKVCQAYRSQSALGHIPKDKPVPTISFDKASVHYDKRTYTLKGDVLSLYTLSGRQRVGYQLGKHQRNILASGAPKEAELRCRGGQWYFNLVIELADG